jgi:Resolvase, N terminal domain/Recombinase zinc beta ribbon domain/Recombinase
VICAIVYAARSKDEQPGKDSVADQVALIEAKLATEPDRQVIGPFTDHASGFTGDRGPGLQQAIDAATAAAAEHGSAELWAWKSDRFGRGTGRMGASRAIGELFYLLRRAGVEMRSVEDDMNVRDERFVGMASKMASEYSESLSANIKRGKRSRAEKGVFPSTSIVLDGYMWTDHDKVVMDPERKHIIAAMWELALQGRSAQAIQLEFARRGYRTLALRKGQKSGPFTTRRIQTALNTPTYAGIAISNGTELSVETDWPTYVSRDDFYRLRSERKARANFTARKRGRPGVNFLLADLATCGKCGRKLSIRTSSYKRVDGTRQRVYVCPSHRAMHPDSPQHCDAPPYDATLADKLVLSGLDDLLYNADAWRGGITAGQRSERDRLAAEVKAAESERDDAERAVERADAVYADALGDDDDAAAVAMAAAKIKRRAAARATTRLSAAQRALGEVQEQVGDGGAAAIERVWQTLSGRLSAADDVRERNAVLREHFEAFELDHEPDDGLMVVPALAPGAIADALRAVGPVPSGDPGDYTPVFVGDRAPGTTFAAVALPAFRAAQQQRRRGRLVAS